MNGYELTYTGQNHTATVYSNFPVRPQCGIYYFEVTIVSKGRDGLLSVGMCTEQLKASGKENNSWAYHGDDGNLYEQYRTDGTIYGPSFTSGDVIGCGINFTHQSIFYTKNGVHLGTAFSPLNTSEPLYPSVGLSSPGEKISANFGQDDFVFDIIHYIEEQKMEAMQPILERVDSMVTSNINQLILSYLIHHGYTGTALVLNDNINTVNNINYLDKHSKKNDIKIKQKLRRAITSGSIDSAIEMIEDFYPGLLEANEPLRFQLKCRKYVESVLTMFGHEETSNNGDSDMDDTRGMSMVRSRTLSMNSITEIVFEEDDGVTFNMDTPKPCLLGTYVPPVAGPVPVFASGRRLSWAAIAACPPNNKFSPNSVNCISSLPSSFDYSDDDHKRKMMMNNRRPSDESLDSSNSSDEGDEDENHDKRALLATMMKEIKKEFGHEVKYRPKLTEYFSLLSYTNPHTSPAASLLDKSGQYSLIDELNVAIQIYQQCPKESSLESIYKQAIHTNKELVLLGHAKSSLIQIEHYLQPPK
ncbi:hypothetical protein BDB01DRAFT_840970 [Pilobolus umbonatus]|nr:hypothetical protein BDB01DRAFT_840970 [Pilobolus umbonatus]